MSRPLDQAALIRLMWFQRLEREGNRQCHGALKKPFSELAFISSYLDPKYVSQPRVCAIGLLQECLPEGSPGKKTNCEEIIAACAGYSPEQAERIVKLNDGHTSVVVDHKTGMVMQRRTSPPETFASIANAVRNWRTYDPGQLLDDLLVDH